MSIYFPDKTVYYVHDPDITYSTDYSLLAEGISAGFDSVESDVQVLKDDADSIRLWAIAPQTQVMGYGDTSYRSSKSYHHACKSFTTAEGEPADQTGLPRPGEKSASGYIASTILHYGTADALATTAHEDLQVHNDNLVTEENQYFVSTRSYLLSMRGTFYKFYNDAQSVHSVYPMQQDLKELFTRDATTLTCQRASSAYVLNWDTGMYSLIGPNVPKCEGKRGTLLESDATNDILGSVIEFGANLWDDGTDDVNYPTVDTPYSGAEVNPDGTPVTNYLKGGVGFYGLDGKVVARYTKNLGITNTYEQQDAVFSVFIKGIEGADLRTATLQMRFYTTLDPVGKHILVNFPTVGGTPTETSVPSGLTYFDRYSHSPKMHSLATGWKRFSIGLEYVKYAGTGVAGDDVFIEIEVRMEDTDPSYPGGFATWCPQLEKKVTPSLATRLATIGPTSPLPNGGSVARDTLVMSAGSWPQSQTGGSHSAHYLPFYKLRYSPEAWDNPNNSLFTSDNSIYELNVLNGAAYGNKAPDYLNEPGLGSNGCVYTSKTVVDFFDNNKFAHYINDIKMYNHTENFSLTTYLKMEAVGHIKDLKFEVQ